MSKQKSLRLLMITFKLSSKKLKSGKYNPCKFDNLLIFEALI